jgi:plasmid stabilization system protein ParE
VERSETTGAPVPKKMKYTIVIKEEAAQESIEAYLWYEDKNAGLGEAFFENLDECYSRIEKNPEAFQLQYKSFRQANLKRFPYIVIFEIEADCIVVYSIFHTSRNPKSKFRKETK